MAFESPTQFLNQLVSQAFNVILTRKQQERLGHHLVLRARGEGNHESQTNGEYWLLRELSRLFAAQTSVVVFDVGANAGDWSTEAFKVFGGQSQIYSFEPSATTFTRLKDNLAANLPMGSSFPCNFGLGREDRSLSLFVTAQGARTNSVYARRDLAHLKPELEEIQIRSGDQFCSESGIQRIDFLKIDTEGCEMDVMLGLERMLTERKIGFLQFEYGGSWTDARTFLYDAFDLLIPKGYTLGKLHPKSIELISDYKMEMDNFRYANYVAMLPEYLEFFEQV